MEKLHPASYEEFLATYNIDAPENFNFAFDVIDRVASTEPDRLAMIHIDDNGKREEYTFGWFARQSSKLANALAGRGIGKGDPVMLILYRRVEFWVSMIALHKVGALPVPSPNLLTVKDIVYRAQTAEIKAVIVEHSIAERVQAAKADSPSIKVFVQAGNPTLLQGWEHYDDLVENGSDKFPRTADSPGGEDPLLIFFSSGTTGMPKMVEHSHSYPLGHIVTATYWHDLNPGDIQLTLADTGWGKTAWGKLYGQWHARAVVFVWDFRGKFEPERLLEIMTTHGVNVFCAPPTVYRFMIRQDLTKYDFSKLRHCCTAGELLNEGVFHVWKEKTGLSIHEGYGQTETTLQLATFPFMTPKAGALGKPTPGWDLVLLDETGEPCPPGVEGEICVRIAGGAPKGLFTGYLKEPNKTASVMYEGYYHTGDKAWMDEDGYYWFLGRVDDLIKSSGYRIGPFEVESALITHPAVIEAAVTGIPDDQRGQIVKATVVLAGGFQASDALTRELQDHVKKVTAPYKYPRVIDYVAELPKTISGKIKRAEIRAKDSGK